MAGRRPRRRSWPVEGLGGLFVFLCPPLRRYVVFMGAVAMSDGLGVGNSGVRSSKEGMVPVPSGAMFVSGRCAAPGPLAVWVRLGWCPSGWWVGWLPRGVAGALVRPSHHCRGPRIAGDEIKIRDTSEVLPSVNIARNDDTCIMTGEAMPSVNFARNVGRRGASESANKVGML